jgi:hypothetical protein
MNPSRTALLALALAVGGKAQQQKTPKAQPPSPAAGQGKERPDTIRIGGQDRTVVIRLPGHDNIEGAIAAARDKQDPAGDNFTLMVVAGTRGLPQTLVLGSPFPCNQIDFIYNHGGTAELDGEKVQVMECRPVPRPPLKVGPVTNPWVLNVTGSLPPGSRVRGLLQAALDRYPELVERVSRSRHQFRVQLDNDLDEAEGVRVLQTVPELIVTTHDRIVLMLINENASLIRVVEALRKVTEEQK